MTNHPLRNLIADKTRLDGISSNSGTPVYLYSKERLQENLSRLDTALKASFDKYHICYAVKANSNPHLIKEMKSYLPHIGADCASPGEIEAARLAGISGDECIYTGNYESIDDLKYAYGSKININLDDISSLDRLAEIGIPERISFRLNPGFGKGMFAQINTGGETAKFGVPRHDIVAAYKKAQDLGINRFGLQCMTGSGVLDAGYFSLLLKAILTVAGDLEAELKIRLEYISIGGGIGIPYRDEESSLPIDKIMQDLGRIFYNFYDKNSPDCPAIWLEPGKYIIGDCGFILSKVTGIKKSYRTFIGLDAGMETILRPALYSAYHRFLKVGAPDEKSAGNVDFTGRICENTDRQAIDRPFPKIKEGDLVAIMDAGAYGFVMSQNYNSRPRSAEVLISNTGEQLIRKRETINEIYAPCNI